jgi:hypothetical protein
MAGKSRFVAYERVSTRRQGASGLGLAAQRKSIDDFVASRGAEVIGRFTEVESGKLADRPELAKALHLAKVTGATLLIAKLDRLSRNAAFLLTLRDSGVRSGPPTCRRPTTSPWASWHLSPSRSARRSPSARARRWRLPGRAG